MRVTNRNGYDEETNAFTYEPAPTVGSVSPDIGPVAGNSTITITGTGFTDSADTAVTFGGIAATSVNVVSATSLTCRTPAAAGPGAVTVRVTNRNGYDEETNAFTYEPAPTVGSVSPDIGPVAGNSTITITGTGFTDSADTAVTFGGIAATSVNVVSATSLTCRTPAAAGPGAVTVRVTNRNGYDEKTDAFTYEPAPTVGSVSPDIGPVAGNSTITITGTGFTDSADTAVTFGGIAATSVNVVSATSLTCRTPAAAGPGAVTVRVTNRNGYDEETNAFTYEPAPTVGSVSPDIGPVAGNSTITITGTGFTDSADTTVTFGSIAATSVNVVSATSLTCRTPAAAGPGAVTVRVTNRNGYDEETNAFTYEPAPTVGSVSPDIGPVAGNSTITITGTGFTDSADTAVTFGGIAATSVNVVSATSLTCRTPAAAGPGAVTVRVTNRNGYDEKTDAFTYYRDTIGTHIPASILIFPIVDSTAGNNTIITVTNTCVSRMVSPSNNRPYGEIQVRYYYVDGLYPPGTVSDRAEILTPGDTLTVLAGAHGPDVKLGYLVVVAEDPESGESVRFNHLIGDGVVVHIQKNKAWSIPAIPFEAVLTSGTTDNNGRLKTDANGNGCVDFDGLEFSRFPDKLFISSFIEQRAPFQGSLVLVSGLGPRYEVTFDVVFYNNDEGAFSRSYGFTCWARMPLTTISRVTAALEGTASETASGWARLDGSHAIDVLTGHVWKNEGNENDLDPPILGFFVQDLVGFKGLVGSHLLHHTGEQNGWEFPWKIETN